MPPRRLMLVDGSFALHRAFHAIRGLATSTGIPTNALFGFVRMLDQLRDQWRPTHWAVVFDGAPRRRSAAWPAYKAQRPPTPPPLAQQFGSAREYLLHARVPALRLAEEEADDVMATLAVRAAEAGDSEVLLATNDKDLFQVVSDRIAVLRPVAGGAERVGPAEVRQKTGVAPAQIVDWLALMGDSVDNIPGVRGVGPKTAAELLGSFGDVATLLQQLDRVPSEKTRERLSAAAGDVRRNLLLVRLDTAVDCPLDWDALRVAAPDNAALAAFFETMEFRSLAQKLREPTLF